MLETVIRGGTVILPQGPCQADLGVGEDGRFHAIALPGELNGKNVVSADGLIVLPGGVDPDLYSVPGSSRVREVRRDIARIRTVAQQKRAAQPKSK